MSNTVKSNNNQDIYINSIYMIMDEYIEELEDRSMIYDVNVYGGLLKRIYSTLFRPSRNDRVLYNSNTKLDTSDIYTLDDIWNVYTDIAAKCKRAILIEDFSVLTGIHKDTFYSWAKGEYRNASSAHSDFTKKWIQDAKTSRLRGASAGNVGMIFLCKAVDGLVEAQPQTVEIADKKLRLSPEQIADKYKNDNKPAIPVFDAD